VEKDFTGLLETMEKQSDVYERLLSLANEKQPVLVKGNIPELEKITKAEEILILQIGRLEEKRQVLHRSLASHFALSPGDLTVSELETLAGEEMAAKLKLLCEKMVGTLQKLETINRSNSYLIEKSLDYLDFSLNVITSDNTASSYNGKEEKEKDKPSKIFDRKV